MAIRVNTIRRIIVAVCKHIKSGKAVTGAYIAVRIDEPANLGVIVTALEIIEACFGIVIVAAVAERVDLSHAAGCRDDFSVGVIVICRDLIAGGINQIHHVALEIGNVIIGRCCRTVAIDQAVRHTDVVVVEVQRFGDCAVRDCFPQQFAQSIDILVGSLILGSAEISPPSRMCGKTRHQPFVI